MSDYNVTIHDQGDLARIADLNGLIDMMRENAVDREKRIAELEAGGKVLVADADKAWDGVHELQERIAELEAKATANRKYTDEAEARIAELEAELAHAQERTAKKYSLWVKAETELDALKEPKRPEGPPNQYSKGWWTKTKPVNREGGEG